MELQEPQTTQPAAFVAHNTSLGQNSHSQRGPISNFNSPNSNTGQQRDLNSHGQQPDFNNPGNSQYRNFNGSKNQRCSHVRCQVCNRVGHKAVACCNQFNQQFGFSGGHTHQQQSLPPQVQLAKIPPPPSVLSPDA
ncbi:hypothetical protein NL676_007503 [Syzygium grande]|nr:hypothetical protein NL676_007503 [Syzygium grande]